MTPLFWKYNWKSKILNLDGFLTPGGTIVGSLKYDMKIYNDAIAVVIKSHPLTGTIPQWIIQIMEPHCFFSYIIKTKEKGKKVIFNE